MKEKPYVEAVESNGRPDEVVAADAWEGHLKRNQLLLSLIPLLHCFYLSVI